MKSKASQHSEKAIVTRERPRRKLDAEPTNRGNPRRKAAAGSSQPRLKIVVADGNGFMRDVISGMLSTHNGRYKVIAQAADAQSAVAACERIKPDLLILDLDLPDECGTETAGRVKRASPATRVLLCASVVREGRVLAIMQSGADGFIEKINKWTHFINAIERVAGGEHYFCWRESTRLRMLSSSALTAPPMRRQSLTKRELEVLKLVAGGDPSKAIARTLGVCVGTVDVHRANVMKKLQIKNSAGMVAAAFEAGWVGSSIR